MRLSRIVRVGFGCVVLLTGCLESGTDDMRDAGSLENESPAEVDEPLPASTRLNEMDFPSSAKEPGKQVTKHYRADLGAASPPDSAATSQARDDEMDDERGGPLRSNEIEDRRQFEITIDTRFQKVDRSLAMLEVRIFQEGLRDRFAGSLGRLYHLRNEVALAIAEAETAPDQEFVDRKAELIELMDELAAVLTSATVAADSILAERRQRRPKEKLWL